MSTPEADSTSYASYARTSSTPTGGSAGVAPGDSATPSSRAAAEEEEEGPESGADRPAPQPAAGGDPSAPPHDSSIGLTEKITSSELFPQGCVSHKNIWQAAPHGGWARAAAGTYGASERMDQGGRGYCLRPAACETHKPRGGRPCLDQRALVCRRFGISHQGQDRGSRWRFCVVERDPASVPGLKLMLSCG
uniref:Uncharacterized protein n=1 Tax=Tetraselmis sp. GSL018 TaxID=582737 RepID=A0A061QPQ3_9CHLO